MKTFNIKFNCNTIGHVQLDMGPFKNDVTGVGEGSENQK